MAALDLAGVVLRVDDPDAARCDHEVVDVALCLGDLAVVQDVADVRQVLAELLSESFLAVGALRPCDGGARRCRRAGRIVSLLECSATFVLLRCRDAGRPDDDRWGWWQWSWRRSVGGSCREGMLEKSCGRRLLGSALDAGHPLGRTVPPGPCRGGNCRRTAGAGSVVAESDHTRVHVDASAHATPSLMQWAVADASADASGPVVEGPGPWSGWRSTAQQLRAGSRWRDPAYSGAVTQFRDAGRAQQPGCSATADRRFAGAPNPSADVRGVPRLSSYAADGWRGRANFQPGDRGAGAGGTRVE